MATRRKILLPSISGIVAGSIAGTVGTFNLPNELRYSKIQIVYVDGGGSPKDINALFDDILVFKNTQVQRTHTADELERLNAINGSQYGRKQIGAGAAMRQSLEIFFLEPWRKDKVDADGGAWNVSQALGWKTFQITLKLLAAMPATGSIIAYAWVDDVLSLPSGKQQAIKKVHRQQIPASGTSIDITTLPAADAYQTILMKHPATGYIQKATLKLNGAVYHDQVVREDQVAHLTSLGLNPVDTTTANAFGYELVLDADDPVNSALPAAGGSLWLQLQFSQAAAGNVVALIERVGGAD